MSKRHNNSRRRQNREKKRRQKKVLRQIRNNRRLVQQNASSRQVAASVRVSHLLEWLAIAIYVGLGAFFLYTEGHDPKIIGFAYCTIGSIHATIRLLAWLV